jgi:hypothetical protein
MALWVIIIVIAGAILVGALVHAMAWPSKLDRWRSRPAARGSAERHRVIPRSRRR